MIEPGLRPGTRSHRAGRDAGRPRSVRSSTKRVPESGASQPRSDPAPSSPAAIQNIMERRSPRPNHAPERFAPVRRLASRVARLARAPGRQTNPAQSRRMRHRPPPDLFPGCVRPQWDDRLLPASSTPTTDPLRSSGKIIDLLIHLVSGLDHLGVGFLGALADDQIDELFHHAHVGLFGVTLKKRANAFLTARIADHRLSRSVRRKIEVAADARQARWIREIGELDLAGDLGVVLSRLKIADRPIGGDRY